MSLALAQPLQDRSDRLLVLRLEEVMSHSQLCSIENALPLIFVTQVDTGELSLEMQNHLQLNTYLDTQDTNFWSKLR